ncbi:MAG: hypothetical protein OXN27_11975 [Candidatus Poribacteria bacterium]|nr:hypothetical protein [Candidatus Poribacteria bacterium]
MPSSTFSFNVPSEFESTEVPIYFTSEDNSPSDAHIDVFVNKVKLRLFIDTGHGYGTVSLPPSVLNRLEVIYTGGTKENHDFKGQKYESRQYLLPKVEIGSLVLDQLPGYEFFSRYDGLGGLIGLVLLNPFNVLIDYPNRKFGLYRKGFYPDYLKSQGWTKVQLVPPLSLPVKLKDYEETFIFCLDTGVVAVDEERHSYGMIRSASKLGKLLQQNETLEPDPSDVEVLGKFNADPLRTSCNYRLAPMDFMLVDYKYPKRDGILGHNFFSKYSVFIDFTQDKIHLCPRTNSAS